MSYNDVYYRVLAGKNHEPMVCCLQDFDEYDYDKKRWLTEQKFETEELAEDWILANRQFVIDACKTPVFAAAMARARNS